MKASSTATSGRARASPALVGLVDASAVASSTCAGKYGRSPRWRPPRTIARFTQARPPSTLTARMSASLVVTPVLSSTACWCSTRDSAPSWLRISAACSNCSASACAIICACSASITSCCSPSQEALGVARRRARSPRRAISPTHGPEQRLIWYSRHGRVRLANTVSSQVRSWNTFCSSWIDSFTAQALGIRPEVAVPLVDRAAVVGDARKRRARRSSGTDSSCRRETGC